MYASALVPQFLTTLPFLYFAQAYVTFKRGQAKITESEDEIIKLWLLKNGDQIAFQTRDGQLHKMDIAHIKSHGVYPNPKTKELEFSFSRADRSYNFTNLNAKTLNYDLVDRVVHGIPIDADKFQGLFHHLIYKQ